MILINKAKPFLGWLFLLILPFGCSKHLVYQARLMEKPADSLVTGFLDPPGSARPGVYWYFMDGNRNKESVTKDLESMKEAGIGNVIFLEVNVGVPRGNVNFLSEDWQNQFAFAVSEAKRLGIEISLGTGPGWAGSGGPWVPLNESMQHLVSSTTLISATDKKKVILPIPLARKPFFGYDDYTSELKKQREEYYEDVAVLAFPTPGADKKINDIDEKALFIRPPYSSGEGVKQYLTSSAGESVPAKAAIPVKDVIDLTGKMAADGTLNWKVPPGRWTVMRFGRRNSGSITRPAPMPGLGFEVDKFDTVALNHHLNHYIGTLLKKTGEPDSSSAGGLKRIHIDSWEMGAQNWTPQFRQEFIKRRGYDPLPYYPVYEGNIVGGLEMSERFLWDLRKTSQDLILEFHAGFLKIYAHKHGMRLSIEPYDMNPTADLELGSVADMPMAEFWSKGIGFNTTFSCAEATSIAHINNKPIVAAEAFTALEQEGWKQYPGSMKEQGDWAFAAGINRFVYHTFASQTLADNLKPGMTMGPFGVHWNRSQTWWPMVGDYHKYVARCQFMLQQGRTVADILFLTPEGAPHVFRPPTSALTGEEPLRDRRGYNFDGCAPGQLLKASVKDNKIVFPGGASYNILVLPDSKTMTPALLEKIRSLIFDGATVVGMPPHKAPGLSNYPICDNQVRQLAETIWGSNLTPPIQTTRVYGKGKIIFGGEISTRLEDLYPTYSSLAALLNKMDIPEDFSTQGETIRYTHRVTANRDIYFISNKTGRALQTTAIFRTDKLIPSLWNPITGELRKLSEFKVDNNRVSIPIQLDAFESYFVIFEKGKQIIAEKNKPNFLVPETVAELGGPWTVSFDTIWGGPKKIVFDKLTDWTKHANPGIKFYSGIASYKKAFTIPGSIKLQGKRFYLNLGDVKNLARVRLNGRLLGVVWTAPWKIDITEALKSKDNQLEIEVANLWPNRLIGDEYRPDDGIKNGKWPDWLLNGTPRTSGRFTFTTFKHYSKDSPLLTSGLLGPVIITRTNQL